LVIFFSIAFIVNARSLDNSVYPAYEAQNISDTYRTIGGKTGVNGQQPTDFGWTNYVWGCTIAECTYSNSVVYGDNDLSISIDTTVESDDQRIYYDLPYVVNGTVEFKFYDPNDDVCGIYFQILVGDGREMYEHLIGLYTPASATNYSSYDSIGDSWIVSSVSRTKLDWVNLSYRYNTTLKQLEGRINGVNVRNWSIGTTDNGFTRIALAVRSEGLQCPTYIADIFAYNGSIYPEPVETVPPALSDAICTSCLESTNKTPDTTPTINITCTDGCQMVRISNDSTYTFVTATNLRDCAPSVDNVWICTLPSSDKIASEGITPLYFWGNGTNGLYHSAWNATINVSYSMSYNISFGIGIASIKWIVPFYTGTTAYNVSPVNETNIISLWEVGNNGTATGQLQLRLNSSYPDVITECSGNSAYENPFVINQNWQVINGSILAGEIYPIWCRRNYTAIPIKKIINWQFNFTSI
jgi:hypothetical protein